MDLRIDWQLPVVLSDGKAEKLIYTCDLEQISDVSGVYVFARKHGKRFEALYVGKAGCLRERVKSQLHNLKLMMHLKGALKGQRVLLLGHFRAGRAQQESICLPLIERALIRYYLSEGHNLVNIQGARLRHHSIMSAGAKIGLPDTMLLEQHLRTSN